jgi:dTDP-4-dehydrorhamnose 3,5-epimerase
MSCTFASTEHEDEMTLLQQTLDAAVQDRATVTATGASLQRLPHGVVVRKLVTHIDSRGTVTELYDPRWGLFEEPLVFTYMFTIRAGYAKGWNLHRRHKDRYCIVQGEMALVLYDPRPDSPTCGDVCRLVLSAHDRCLVSVPENVWHADHNIGSTDALVVNHPTIPYDHADPDKWRLPLDSPLIPYSFPPGTLGW